MGWKVRIEAPELQAIAAGYPMWIASIIHDSIHFANCKEDAAEFTDLAELVFTERMFKKFHPTAKFIKVPVLRIV